MRRPGSGFKVRPRDVEEVLYGQNAMKMTVRLGVEFCRRQLSRYKIPEAMELRTQFPVSRAAKLLRRALRHVALA